MTNNPQAFPDIAMQINCVHCLKEQWAVMVYPISMGVACCSWCGKKSEPMTKDQYASAMLEARKRESEGI